MGTLPYGRNSMSMAGACATQSPRRNVVVLSVVVTAFATVRCATIADQNASLAKQAGSRRIAVQLGAALTEAMPSKQMLRREDAHLDANADSRGKLVEHHERISQAYPAAMRTDLALAQEHNSQGGSNDYAMDRRSNAVEQHSRASASAVHDEENRQRAVSNSWSMYEFEREENQLDKVMNDELERERHIEEQNNRKYRFYSTAEEEKEALIDSGLLKVEVIGERSEMGSLMVDCKGVVWRGWPEKWSRVSVPYDGCGQSDGSCLHDLWWSGDGTHYSQDSPAGPVETIVVLTQPQWGAYYHFVIDSLSRYVFVKEQYPALVEESETYFHTGYVDAVGQAWAQLLGIKTDLGKDSRILSGSWLANRIIWPPSNACANLWRGSVPHAVRGMRDLIAKRLPSEHSETTSEKTGPSVLIIRRKQDGMRYIDNHDALVETVREELPHWHVSEFGQQNGSTFSLPDIKTSCLLFNRASIVIGPHGAGMANLVCAKTGTALVELQQQPHTPDFQLLASKLGLPYFGIPVESMTHEGHGSVNLNAVREMLQGARYQLLANGALSPRDV